MTASTECLELIRMAAPDGILSIFELDALQLEPQIQEAKKLGLLKQTGPGGWGVDDIYTLTAAGKELVSLSESATAA